MPKTILVEVKPNSSQEEIEIIASNVFKVKVMAPASEGRANRALIKLLANYFKVAKSQIEIKSGKTSKNKVINIYFTQA